MQDTHTGSELWLKSPTNLPTRAAGVRARATRPKQRPPGAGAPKPGLPTSMVRFCLLMKASSHLLTHFAR